MNGITFIVDERSQKTAAVIDLHRHSRMWEDFSDTLIPKSRAGEPREPQQSVRHRLRTRGQRHG